MSTQTPPSIDTVEDVFNVSETEITALAEYLDSSLFEGFDVFAPDPRGRKREFDPYGLFLANLYCYHNEIYGQRMIYPALRDETVWR